MFGQEPQLPIEFLLGRVQEPVEGPVTTWIQEHQRRLQAAYEGARDRLKAAADKRADRHDAHTSEPLKVNQLVYLRDYSIKERNKIQDQWNPRPFKIVMVSSGPGTVYTVAPLDQPQKQKQVSRELLKPLPSNLSEKLLCAPQPLTDHPEVVMEQDDVGDLYEWHFRLPSGQAVLTEQNVARAPQLQSDCGPEETAPSSVTNHSSAQAGPSALLRRTSRVNAGRHGNIHNLPHSVNLSLPNFISVSVVFRPWL